MNKRTIAVFGFLSLVGMCWAEGNLPGGFVLGSRVEMERLRNGGGGEAGFVLTDDPGLRSMLIIQVSGYGTSVSGMGEIAAKITLGGVSENRYHTYGFLRGGMCLSGDPELFWDLSGGGGFELFSSTNQAFFLEMGGGFNWHNSPFSEEEGFGGYAFIAPGIRHYF